MKVYLSPSNQGNNRCVLGHSEKQHCEELANRMVPYLKAYGIESKVGLQTGNGALEARVAESKSWGAHLHLPLHTNATAKGTARGTRFGFYPGRADSSRVCDIFKAHWAKFYPYPDRVKTTTYTFYEARKPSVPAVYVELIFHDNRADAEWFHAHMEGSARVLADAVADFFGVYKGASSPEQENALKMPDVKLQLTRKDNADFHSRSVGDVIVLPMEEYLLGVVAQEMGNPHIEAAKAQAVAARTYAYSRVRNGATINDTTQYQAYRAAKGASKSYSRAHDGVRLTKGQMLYYNGQPIETAVYSASNGGTMVSAQERWGGERPYLVSGPDPWTAASGQAKWGHGVGMSQAGAKYAAEKGVKFKDILAFYYPGTEILPAEVKIDPAKPPADTEPKPKPPVDVNPPPLKYLHTAKVVTRLPIGVNLWTGVRKYGTNGMAPRGAEVYVLEEVNARWVKAQYRGRVGYIDRQYLSEPPKDDALYMAKVNTIYPLSLGLWQEPNKRKRLQYIANGREIEVLKEINATWAQVRVGRAVGYVDRKYLKVV